jgi:hypothetical protein
MNDPIDESMKMRLPSSEIQRVNNKKSFFAARCMQLVLLAGLLSLTACGVNTVTVKGNYPSPNINKIPLTVGVYYDEALRDFAYIEYTDNGKEEYRVLSGPSHMDLFGSVLPAMFDRVVLLPNPDQAATAGVDLVFAPAIEEFQLALPQKTRLDAYEVWVKYNMRLTAPDGGYIADWVLTAYGKTSSESMRSAESGINDATISALRDLGSNFALSFTNVPDVRDWLNSHQ